MSEGPVGGAYVEISPQVDEAKFDAAINKILGRIDAGFARAGLGAQKMASQTKAGGEEAATGLRRVESQLNKNISALDRFASSGKRTESVFRRVGTRIATAFSIYAVARFTKESIDVGVAYERMSRVVEQAFKTTGHIAGVTTESFNDLTATIAASTGIAETSVRMATSQLIAFTNIRNSVGKGNDIFTRTAQAVQDISVRTGLGSIQIARSLGKALEDPSKASMVLRRASIVLTEQQKKQIDVFQKSNNALGAQKIILEAIEQKYGGAAKAAADPLKQLAVATNQIERSLGEALIPTVDDFAGAIIRNLPAIKQFVAQVGVKLHEALVFVTPFIKAAARQIVDIVNAFSHSKGLQTFTKYLLGSVIAFKLAKEAAKAFKDVMLVVDSVLALFDEEAAVADALIAPEVLVVGAVVAVGAALVYAYEKVKPFHNAVDQLASTIKEKVVPVLHEMWAYFQQNILPTLEQIGTIIERVVLVAFKIWIAYVRDILFPVLKTLWSILSVTLLPLFKMVGQNAVIAFKAIPDALNNFVLPALRFLANAVINFFDGVIHGAAKAFGWVPGIGPQLKNAAKDFDQFKKDVNNALNGITPNKTVTIHINEVVGAPGTALYNSQVPQQAQIDAGKKAAAAAASAAIAGAAPPPTTFGTGGGTGTTKKAKGPANLVELIRDVANALNDGLKKGSEAASKTVSALEAKIKSTLSGTLQAGLTSQAVAFIEKQRAALVGLAGAYFKVSQQTDALKKKVDVLTKAATDFKNSVISALQQTSNLDAFLNQSGSNGVGNVDKSPLAQASFNGIAVGLGSASGQAKGLVNFLGDQVTKLTSFQSNLNTLISRVGDSAFVQELASKGLASADLVASLAAAPASALTQINKLQTQILTLQHNIANAAGKRLQDSADAANALLKQSVTTQDKMLTEIKALSHNIVNGLARILGTKVPKFAEGGILNRPTFGLYGEDGREVVIPLTRPSRARSLMDQTGLTDLARARGASPQSGPTYHAEFNLVPQGDPAVHAAQVSARLGAMVTR